MNIPIAGVAKFSPYKISAIGVSLKKFFLVTFLCFCCRNSAILFDQTLNQLNFSRSETQLLF